MEFNDKELAVMKLMFENFDNLFSITECIEINGKQYYREDLYKLSDKIGFDF